MKASKRCRRCHQAPRWKGSDNQTCIACWQLIDAGRTPEQRLAAAMSREEGRLVSFHPCERCGAGRQWLAAGETICMRCWNGTEGRALFDVARLEADHHWVKARVLHDRELGPAAVSRLRDIHARLTADSCTVADADLFPDWPPARLWVDTFDAVEAVAKAAGVSLEVREGDWKLSYWKDGAFT